MNNKIKSFLRRFILVLFDDILIYNYTLELHICHLKLVLENEETIISLQIN
jgi:hypothetical protein